MTDETGQRSYHGEVDFTVVSVSPDQAEGRMALAPAMLNPFGSVHAGAMIWFADVVATRLVLQGRPVTAGMSGFPLAINLVANLLSNTDRDALVATARFVKRGRTLSTVRTVVATEAGRPLVEVTTTHLLSR
ncbi:PaaI family thioesterase [uncultured Paracoccus sp.]|uniref:PaaI family thioesterase n=1 Tax=uncultured Paracoccus sp. TaxID=189685 RepID=UPI0026142E53|nr:PaaI family thioesterase [uncultured Paracoccus sp.]